MNNRSPEHPPRVSVIIPAYNCEDTILSAIKSAEKQTLSPYEIIVVDDGSEDKTHRIVKKYFENKENMILLKHKHNRGQNAAQNTGLGAANGEYIAFLDSDDEWMENKLEKQISYLKNKPSSFVACYCGVLHTDPTKRNIQNVINRMLFQHFSRFFDQRIREGQENIIKEILTNKFHLGGMSTLVVKQEALHQVGGFDENIERITDLTFVLDLLEIGKIAYIDEDLTKKFGTNSTKADDLINYKIAFLSEHCEKVIKLEFEEEKVISSHKYDIAKFYLREGEFRRGIAWLRQSTLPRTRELYSLITSTITGLLQRIRRS